MRDLHDLPQRSEAWLAARCGRLTASEAHVPAMRGRTKGEESSTRRDLRVRIALERITGRAITSEHVNADMARGIALEPAALAAYEARAGQLLTAVGFITLGDDLGCSPDGVQLDAAGAIVGGVEVKCPRPATHLGYLRDPGTLVDDYRAQLLHTLYVTGAPWWDIASYGPDFPPSAQLVVVRVVPTTAPACLEADLPLVVLDLDPHVQALRQFLTEVEADVHAITTLTGVPQHG